jgi:NAD-dependent deacetylase
MFGSSGMGSPAKVVHALSCRSRIHQSIRGFPVYDCRIVPFRLPADLEEQLSAVRSVGVISGAGISRESGIRTYRGEGGIYDDPQQGDRTIEALSGATLDTDPDRTWRVVAELARQSLDARPNPAHHALVRIEQRVERFVLLTQNVDGLHRLAGSQNVIEIHGDVFDTRCRSCGKRGRLDRATMAGLEGTPRCTVCGGPLRPDAVLFGEMIPEERYARLVAEFHSRSPDLLIVAGTSAPFPYIAEPVRVAKLRGRLTVEVNPEETVLSRTVDYALRGPAGEILPSIDAAI